MANKPIEEIAEIIRTKAAERNSAADPSERQEVECHIGGEVFCSIFAQDTTVLGPWQLKTAGKRTDPKYQAFKQRWDQLCSQEGLGVTSKDLTAWCRARAVEQLLIENGLDPNELNWQQLNDIQRLRAVNQMVEKARKAMQQEAARQAEDPTVPISIHRRGAVGLTKAAPPAQCEPATAEPPTLAELERLLEHPSELLQHAAYAKLLTSPAWFKDVPAQAKEQLLARVEAMAKHLESLARSYRDFEAVLRWSRRM